MEYTWEELKEFKSGKILHDEFDEGVRFIVLRGPSHLCAYLGIPKEHPLADFDYELLPIDCHGGLTFGQYGDKYLPVDCFWYGWDYGHCDDYAFYYSDPLYNSMSQHSGKKWLVGDVIKDSWLAILQMKDLIKLAEGIYNKAKAEKEG